MLPRFRAVTGLAVAFATLCPAITRADEGAAVMATLDEATFIERVTERSPRRVAFDSRRRAASAQIGVAGLLPNPTLSFERESVPGLDQTNNYVRLGWSLDFSGRRGLARSAARSAADAERFEVDRDAWSLELDARLAYLEAVYARHQLSRIETARAALVQLLDVLRSRANHGDTSSYDADRAALELDLLDDERATARRVLETARLVLGAFLGEPTTPYDASGPLSLPAPRAAGGEPRRPDLDAARARVKQAQHELRLARRRWVPELELLAGVMVSTSGSTAGVGYNVGIGGALPVFDRGGAAASRARADAKRWQTEIAVIATDARGEAAQAARDLALRIEQADAYARGPATRATDLLRRATSAFREGDRPILELLDVQRTARQVASRTLDLIYEARRAELALRRALGRTP